MIERPLNEDLQLTSNQAGSGPGGHMTLSAKVFVRPDDRSELWTGPSFRRGPTMS
jgi:hypothetical protein